MAYDEELADRMRAALSQRDDITEKRMFGGLAFILGGNMAVVASGEGGMMVRAGAEAAEALLDEPGVEQVEMRGRAMTGWIRVSTAQLDEEQQLVNWIQVGTDLAEMLPTK